MLSKCGKNKKWRTRLCRHYHWSPTDVLSKFWRLPWWITEQTHRNIESSGRSRRGSGDPRTNCYLVSKSICSRHERLWIRCKDPCGSVEACHLTNTTVECVKSIWFHAQKKKLWEKNFFSQHQISAQKLLPDGYSNFKEITWTHMLFMILDASDTCDSWSPKLKTFHKVAWAQQSYFSTASKQAPCFCVFQASGDNRDVSTKCESRARREAWLVICVHLVRVHDRL